MIDRYSRPAMARLFAPEHKLELWLKIEMAVAKAMAQAGEIDSAAVARLEAAVAANREAIIDVPAIDAIEQVTKHDVIAFLTHVEKLCGADARLLHLGMTSSDLLDTTLACQLSAACDLIDAGVERLLAALKQRAFEHKTTITMGRSHGIHAEPTTFGLKLARFYAEFDRNRQRIRQARANIATCAISGAVGTFANISPAIEEAVADELGLAVEPISSQVIPRDRHAELACALAVLAGSIENIAVEVRHLQRSEVREAEEYFSKGQKGSSAMPHKRNPVLSENLTGLARLIRAAALPALENIALWHERDISHSSVERVTFPDSMILADFALHRLASMIENLVVNADRMQSNLDRSLGLHNSQRVLLHLTSSGLPRQQAYELVQRHAMSAWHEEKPLVELLVADPTVTQHGGTAAIQSLFDDTYHLNRVDEIFARVFADA